MSRYEVMTNGFKYTIVDTESRIRVGVEAGQKVMAETYEGEIVAGIIAAALNDNIQKIEAANVVIT
jgi:hypothetical protein